MRILGFGKFTAIGTNEERTTLVVLSGGTEHTVPISEETFTVLSNLNAPVQARAQAPVPVSVSIPPVGPDTPYDVGEKNLDGMLQEAALAQQQIATQSAAAIVEPPADTDAPELSALDNIVINIMQERTAKQGIKLEEMSEQSISLLYETVKKEVVSVQSHSPAAFRPAFPSIPKAPTSADADEDGVSSV